jgi:hypothetical protein
MIRVYNNITLQYNRHFNHDFILRETADFKESRYESSNGRHNPNESGAHRKLISESSGIELLF